MSGSQHIQSPARICISWSIEKADRNNKKENAPALITREESLERIKKNLCSSFNSWPRMKLRTKPAYPRSLFCALHVFRVFVYMKLLVVLFVWVRGSRFLAQADWNHEATRNHTNKERTRSRDLVFSVAPALKSIAS